MPSSVRHPPPPWRGPGRRRSIAKNGARRSPASATPSSRSATARSAEQELPVERVLEEERAAARRPGDAEPVQLGHEEPDVPGRVGEDGDVAEASRPRQADRGVGDPHEAAVHRAPDPGGQHLGLARSVGRRGSCPGGERQEGDARLTRALAPLVEPLVRHRAGFQVEVGLSRRGWAEDLVEALVEVVDERRLAAEVGRERHEQVRPRRDDRADRLVDGDVGAAETVDRLLGVADQRELPRREHDVLPAARRGLALAQVEDDLRLERVGVLELVDEDVVEESSCSSARTGRSSRRRSRSRSRRSTWSTARWRAFTFSYIATTAGKQRTSRVAIHFHSGRVSSARNRAPRRPLAIPSRPSSRRGRPGSPASSADRRSWGPIARAGRLPGRASTGSSSAAIRPRRAAASAIQRDPLPVPREALASFRNASACSSRRARRNGAGFASGGGTSRWRMKPAKRESRPWRGLHRASRLSAATSAASAIRIDPLRLGGPRRGARRSRQLLGEAARLGRLQEQLEGLVAEGVGVLDHLVGRAEPRLDRLQAQQPVGEAVDGADEGGVGLGQGAGEALAPDRRAAEGQLGEQAFPDAELQLSRGLAGEGQRCDALERDLGARVVLRCDHLHEPVHEEGRLPGAGAGVHEDVHAARRDGAVPVGLIRSGNGRAHASPFLRARNSATAPLAFTSYAADRAGTSTPQTGWKGQKVQSSATGVGGKERSARSRADSASHPFAAFSSLA